MTKNEYNLKQINKELDETTIIQGALLTIQVVSNQISHMTGNEELKALTKALSDDVTRYGLRVADIVTILTQEKEGNELPK